LALVLLTGFQPGLPGGARLPLLSRALDPRFGVAEGFRRPSVLADLGAGWERVVLSWADIQPDGPDDFSWLGRTAPATGLLSDARAGVELVGLLQFTPTWAQRDPANGERSVPRNLDLPFDDPDNYWGRFVYETARFYMGEIDEWIVWNEPEFRPGDPGAGGSYTWLGTDQEFAQLMKVAYLAIKKANPRAVVSFPGTSYWVDQAAGRPQFYDRYLSIIDADPEAAEHNHYHDAVSLNLYRTPDDLVRVHSLFQDIQRRHGLDGSNSNSNSKPQWLLELNAMPTDDRQIPCADRQAASPFKTSMDQQAAYAVQAFALAAGAGYQRMGFYQMVDDNPCDQPAVWGITRDDGSSRPVADALRTTFTWLSGYTSARFAPLTRTQKRWPVWPDDPTSFIPNWQVYEVALDQPRGRRVTVLWSGDGVPLRARLTRQGVRARLIDRTGLGQPLPADGEDWVVDLPPATAHFATDPPGYHFIGGEPLLLVEDGVPPSAPVTPPRLDIA
jgi:hypothetical protein